MDTPEQIVFPSVIRICWATWPCCVHKLQVYVSLRGGSFLSPDWFWLTQKQISIPWAPTVGGGSLQSHARTSQAGVSATVLSLFKMSPEFVYTTDADLLKSLESA